MSGMFYSFFLALCGVPLLAVGAWMCDPSMKHPPEWAQRGRWVLTLAALCPVPLFLRLFAAAVFT